MNLYVMLLLIFCVFTMMLFYFMIRFWDSNCKKINQTKIMDVIQD